MVLADVHDGFVSKVILAEIERMSLPSVSPDPVHIAYFEGVFGAVTAWRRVAPNSEQATLWLGMNGTEPLGVLKLYRPPEGAARERRAYREWAPALGPWTASFHGGPEADPGAILLGYLPGETATFASSPAVFEAAGRFAARLHGLAHQDLDPVPLVQALHQRLAATRTRGGIQDAAVHDAVEALIDSGEFGARVPCHRDLAPWNWRVDAGCLRVLDFGQSRPDTWLMDLVKLVVAWTPTQETAFFSGYGRALSPGETRALTALVGLHGIGSVQWGLRHEQARPKAEGERALIWFRDAHRRYGLG